MAYTTITDPSVYFQTALYSGNGGGTNNVVNDGNSNLQPDWVWVKERSSNSSHALTNSTNGAGYILSSNNTNDESSASAFTSFDSDGVTVGSDGKTNESGQTYVGWQWKANGGTTASNTDGSITSTVQANTTAGFSIVSYTGVNSSNGQTSTIGHGLNSAPELIICKRRNGTYGWSVGSTTIGNFTSSNVFELNETGAPSATYAYEWGANPTSTVFTTGYSNRTNISGGTFIAYCFAPIQGYSKFGSYTGNGNADGTFIYTGFKPRFFMLKGTGNVSSWCMYDTARDPINQASQKIWANENNAEQSTGAMDFLSNGIKMRINDNDFNGSGYQYLYMAFAENPFVATNGVPTTAN